MEASFHTGFLFAFYFKVLSSIPYLLVNSTGPLPVGNTKVGASFDGHFFFGSKYYICAFLILTSCLSFLVAQVSRPEGGLATHPPTPVVAR